MGLREKLVKREEIQEQSSKESDLDEKTKNETAIDTTNEQVMSTWYLSIPHVIPVLHN